MKSPWHRDRILAAEWNDELLAHVTLLEKQLSEATRELIAMYHRYFPDGSPDPKVRAAMEDLEASYATLGRKVGEKAD